jgi:mannitol-1-/sugar-/sorbitol-6-phosphatase
VTAAESALVHTRGVLFDCDGVLVDSRATAEEAWTAWAHRYGVDAGDVLAGMHGRRSVETVALHLPTHRHAEAVAFIDDLELETAHATVPIPGARELLAAIGPAAYAVVTSAPATLCRARLAAAGLPDPRVLVSSEDVATGKPAPDCYLLGAERLGLPIAACAVFEDSTSGVAAARAAGAGLVVGVGPDAAAYDVDAVVADLRGAAWSDGLRIPQ